MRATDITNKMNSIIDYIERHITDEIDMNQLAQICCCSTYDTCRMFMFTADISISEYIRNRKLTLAGFDLKYNNANVLDTALKYGYNSPVSFARAFRLFHDIAPGKVKNRNADLQVFSRLVFSISVKEVTQMIRKEKMIVDGKEYDAEYYGSADMSVWSKFYVKREFWRLNNAFDDFKNKYKTTDVLPYNNYPAMDIEIGQVFVIDYYKNADVPADRKYYISDGTVWKDMPSTCEVFLYPLSPVRTDEMIVCGKKYDASYFGEQDMSYWSDSYVKRQFWRLEDAYNDLKDKNKLNDVLPYNNYPYIDIKEGQIFVLDYTNKDGAVERRYYMADGTVWRDMPSTREFALE